MIGVVTGVQGMRWYEVTVTGQDAHTGATPMHLRKNALLGAARMIERIDEVALNHPPGVGTVGLVENRPNSRNVVPGEVFFTVDLPPSRGGGARHDGEGDSAPHCRRSWRRSSSTFDEKRIWKSPAVQIRPDADRLRPPRRRAGRISDARHGLRRRPRCRLYRPRGADDDDLRALPGRDQPQRGGSRPPSRNARPARRCCSTRCWSTTGGWAGEAKDYRL